MKFLKLIVLSVVILLTTVGAAQGAPVDMPMAVAPSKPVPKTPANNALVTDYTPDLTWSTSTPAINLDHYEVEVATDPSFAAPTIVDSDYAVAAGTTTFTVAALTPAKTYYWHVRSVSPLAETQGYSSTYSFKTAVEAPTLNSPADGSDILTNRPTFDWSDVLNASGYNLQVSTAYGFTSTLVNATVSYTSSEYTPTVDLPANQTLYWRVRTTNSPYGPSAWSSIFIIHSTAIPASIPALTQPATNKLTDDYTPRLVWKVVTVPSGTTFTEYQIEIAEDKTQATDGSFVTPDVTGSVLDLSTPWFDVPDPADELDPATTYYWHVRAVNTNNITADIYTSSWSTIFSLRTTIGQVMTLNTPPDMFDLLDNKPTFDWSDVTDAPAYTIQISTNGTTFAPLVLTGKSAISEYTPTVYLPKNKTLYWRVRVESALYGPSRWSVVYSFNTANPPSTPVLKLPKTKTLLTNYTPTMTWSMVTLPAGTLFDYYQIQIGKDSTFAVTDIDDTSNTNQYDPSFIVGAPLDPASVYYWHVRACNLDSECSPWSATFTFRTAVPAPALVDPADTSVNAGPFTPIYDWSDVPLASGYYIQVAKNASFGGNYIVFGRTVTTSTTTGLSLPAGTYYWRVRTNNPTFGPSAWSTVFSFTVTP